MLQKWGIPFATLSYFILQQTGITSRGTIASVFTEIIVPLERSWVIKSILPGLILLLKTAKIIILDNSSTLFG